MRARNLIQLMIVSAGFLAMVIVSSPAQAASANLSRSYHSSTGIPNGSIVSLDSKQQGYIVLADSTNGSKLLGVAVANQDSLLAVDPTNATVQVAISGTANTLVSTVNGDIKVGDQISVSPFGGIGMESLPGNRVIGVAQSTFNSKTSGSSTEKVKDTTGKEHRIQIGYLRLAIGIGTGAGTGGGGNQANFLQRLIKALTGHTISTIRIVLSLVVGLVALISLVTLVYASIYGSIVSVGRNPLAKSAIFRTLSSVMIMAFITVGVACVTIYYLLR
jgi:hypothetical protein